MKRTSLLPKCLLPFFILSTSLTYSTFLFSEENQPNTTGDVRVTKLPILLKSVEAEYSQEAIDKRIEGRVTLQLELDPSGNVNDVKVLKGIGYGLDEAAVNAAKQFKFEPAEINHQPSAVSFTFEIDFSLPILPSIFKGYVTDQATKEPVKAEITITYLKGDIPFEEPPSATTSTDEKGLFYFENVPPGTYSVDVNVDTYQQFDTQIELISGKTSTADYQVIAEVDNLTGRVRESGTRTPLPGIEVSVISNNNSTTENTGNTIASTYTDAQGYFKFAGIPAENVTLRLSSDGYDTTTENLEIVDGKITDIELYLEKSAYDEYSVTTTTKSETATVNRHELSLQEIRRIPGANGDVVRSVQNFPGVARAPFVAGAIIVRGSAPGNTGLYVDGARIPNIFHFLLGPAVINSEMIASLDFFPGNFSTYYGHALGGIIELKTRRPKTDRIHGQIEVDIFDTTALVEGPITDDLSFALSARRSYIDAIIPFVIPKSAPIDPLVAPVYYDYQGWLTYTGFEGHTLSFKLFGSNDKIDILFEEKKAPGTTEIQLNGLDFSTGFISGQGEWNWRPKLPLENDLSLTVSYQYNRLDVGPDLKSDIKGLYLQLREDFKYRFSEGFTFRTGVEARNTFGKLQFETPRFEDDTQSDNGGGGGRPAFDRSGIDIDKRGNLLDVGIYTEFQIKPTKDLLLTSGLRFDYYDGIVKTSFQPRVSARWRIIDELVVKGGIGLFTQEPARLIRAGILLEPTDLTFQKAHQYALGFEYTPFDFLTFDVTGFYRDVWDLIGNTNAVIKKGDRVQSQLFSNEGKGRAYGIEFMIRHRPAHRFFGWLAYTLSWAEEYKPNTQKYAPFRFDQRHILTLVAGYNFPYHIDLGLRYRLVTGSPYTPVIGGVYNSDLDKYEKVFGEPFSERLPTFHQLDIRIDYKIIFQRWILGIFLDIQNIYNAKNQEGIQYSYDFTERKGINGIPIFPNVGITAQF